MEKRFNLLRYKELLKIEKNGKFSFLDLELLGLKASLAKQMFYTRKKDYFLLIEEYLSRIISPSAFRSKFLALEKEI